MKRGTSRNICDLFKSERCVFTSDSMSPSTFSVPCTTNTLHRRRDGGFLANERALELTLYFDHDVFETRTRDILLNQTRRQVRETPV